MSFAATARSPYSFTPPYVYRGMGDQLTGFAAEGASTAATILALSPATGPAAPFVAAAAAVVALLGNLFGGCGQTCTVATQYANQAGSNLDQLKAQYFAQPVRTQAMQQAYIQACQQIFAWLKQMCGNPSLGKAGQRCVAERLTPRACPSTLDDSNMGGGKIPFCDYYSFYITPVQNDSAVVPDPVTPSSTTVGNTILNVQGTNWTPYILPGLLVLGGIIFVASGMGK
jgi:hypothetical protein